MHLSAPVYVFAGMWMRIHACAEGACYSADTYYGLLYHHIFHKTYMRNFHNYYLSGKNSLKKYSHISAANLDLYIVHLQLSFLARPTQRMQKNCPAVYLLFAKCKLCVCVCVWVCVCLHVCVCMCVMCVSLHCSPAPIKKHSILTTRVLWSAWQTPECDDGKTESCGHWSWVAFPEADPDPDLLVLPALPPSPFQPKNPAHVMFT